jgi:hypothetical protein
MLILQAFAMLGYNIQNTACCSQVRQKHEEDKTTRFQASFSVCIFGSEIVYLVLVVILSIVLKLDSVVMDQVGHAVSVLILVNAFGYGWIRLPRVPLLHEKAEGSTSVSAGLKQFWKTIFMEEIYDGSLHTLVV